MAARLVDEQPADVVDVVERPPSPLQHGPATELRNAAGDDPERLARRVVIDGPDRPVEGRHRATRVSRRALTAGHSGAITP